MKHLLAITIALLPSAVLAQQFTPQQMLDVMTKSPSHRNVRVHDTSRSYTQKFKCASPGNACVEGKVFDPNGDPIQGGQFIP